MSHIRTKFGSSMMSSLTAATRSRDVTGNWLRKLGASANTMTSKDAHGQLSSLLDYYNRPHSAKSAAEIDWDGHRSRIHTPDVVDKIKAKYEKFMETEYGVQGAVARCGNTTEKMQALDVAMQWNYTLYLTHYSEHLEQLETMRNAGDINDMSNYEVQTYMTNISTNIEGQNEIGNISVSDMIEDGIGTRLCTQFSWGSRYCPPFMHSSEASSSVCATLGKFGN